MWDGKVFKVYIVFSKGIFELVAVVQVLDERLVSRKLDWRCVELMQQTFLFSAELCEQAIKSEKGLYATSTDALLLYLEQKLVNLQIICML
jgi:hypothetical protein